VTDSRDFVALLEARLPAGAMLWQIPWIAYPESVQQHREGEYAWSKLYLVSRRLRWSWGDMKGSWPDAVRAACSRLPLTEQIPLLQESGFAGVVVLRSALADGGAAVTAALGPPQLSSKDGDWLFYALQPASPVPPPDVFERSVTQAVLGPGPFRFVANSPALLLLRRGWWEAEAAGSWTRSPRALLRIPVGVSTGRARLRLTPYVPPGESQSLLVRMSGKPVGQWTFRVQEPVTVEFPLQAPGVLELVVGNPTRPADHGVPDTRSLGVMLHSLEV
jgi:phosphoglycerol transferase